MTKVVSALTARTQFGQILKLASKKSQRFIVDRRGEPLAVIMGIQDFIKSVAPEREVLKAIGEASKRKGTHKLTMREIDAEIKAVRRAKRKQHVA
jgi:prevent-host-death family protein